MVCAYFSRAPKCDYFLEAGCAIISYHLAAFRNAPLTAFLLQHASPKMLYQHYNGVATQPDGKAYFAIKP